MSEIAIEVNNVSKMYRMFGSQRDRVLDLLGIPFIKSRYDEFWALRELDLVVPQGGKIGIIGHNGAGKSTLLKIIAGQVAPTSGRVCVNGKVQALMELGTGFHPEFTGRENVLSALSYQGIVGAAARLRLEEIIDFSELDDFIDNPVKTYSAGMYARLAFSVATAIEPEILIIDEVLGAGDAYFAGKCVDRMNAITQDTGATVLFVSHDTSSVLRLCDRVLWMKKGRCVLDGPSHEVVNEYIDAMRFETELRHRSREMQLAKGAARAIMTSNDVYKKLLFRFRTETAHPRHKHLIRRLILQHGEQPLAQIDVGDAMDNSSQEQNYIISHKSMNWSQPVSLPDGFARYYCDCQGSEFHAPFVLSIPAYLKDEACNCELTIEGSFNTAENVFVDLWDDEKGYVCIGKIEANNRNYSFRLGVNTHKEDPDKPIQPQQQKRRQKEDEFSSSFDRAIAIKDVNMLDADGNSRRVFPQGSELTVVVNYEAFREVQDPVFALTFHRVDGIQMDHKNTKLLGADIGNILGVGTAKFTFSPLRLGPGEYLITIAVLKYLDIENWVDQPPSYDRHDRRYTISIHSTIPGGKNLGAVLQDCRFSNDLKTSC